MPVPAGGGRKLMELTMLYKDPSSGGSGCPSVYMADSGEVVVQGLAIDDATRGNL